MTSVTGLPAMLMRGGSSKGLYLLADDLPADVGVRDDLLCRVMGSPDNRQIDGIGGSHPLTSKVAVISASADPSADVDYLFLQVSVDEALVSDRQNCGNILAGVGPFAVERGLVPIEPTDTNATVRIRMANTGAMATATFVVSDGRPVYDGATAISGVPGMAAPVRLDFDNIAGGSTGSLLPTGHVRDVISGVACTLVDNGMPVVVMRADAVGLTGHESCEELESNSELRAVLEEIRLEAGKLMNLGDITDTTVPKLTMVSPAKDGGQLSTRTFIPHRCHDAIGVLGAISVATAALLPNTPASEILSGPIEVDTVTLEHPSGSFEAVVSVQIQDNHIVVDRAGIIRTARKLMDGTVYPRPEVPPLSRA